MRFRFVPLTIAFAVFSQSPLANAEAFKMHQCERAGVIRTVELQANNESGVPCRVLYHKAMEDQSTTNLWNARKDALFCSKRYDAFIVKLENKLNWSCELLKRTDRSLAEKISTPESINITPSASEERASVNRKTAEPKKCSKVTLTSISTNKPTQNAQSLELERALPISQDMKVSETTLSMEMIKQHFPSGRYVAYEGEQQNDNSRLCPSDGIFMWNTKSPDKPVFELGAIHEFQFDLASAPGIIAASQPRGVVIDQCQPLISTGYCLDKNYTGENALHPALSSYYGCDGRSEYSRSRRPLVLVRTLLEPDSNASKCAISEKYQHMSLAPSPTSDESSISL